MHMTTKKTYTFSECYQLLNVDPKTFRRWLERAEIVPTVSRADSRVKFLTEPQVQLLAQEHERELHHDTTTQELAHNVPYGMYKLLADRVSDVEQELSDTRDVVDKLSQRLSELEEERQQRQALSPTPRAASKAKVRPLPPDLVNLYSFTDEHRAPQNEVRRLIKAGFIHSHVGKRRTEKGRVDETLDQAGRHEFWVQLHPFEGFQMCGQCPHTKESEQI